MLIPFPDLFYDVAAVPAEHFAFINGNLKGL